MSEGAKTEDLNLAGTHLNLCAIFSKLNRHKEAVEHAKQAIRLLEKQIAIKEAKERHNISIVNNNGGVNNSALTQ